MKKLNRRLTSVGVLFFLTSCSRASIQDYENPDFIDVAFYGVDSEIKHSITNLNDEIFHVNPIPVIDYYDDGTWREFSGEWGTGTVDLGPYPIYPGSTVDIMPNFDFRVVDEPGLYRIRHYAWFGGDLQMPDEDDEETFPVVIPFEIED